MTQAGGAGDAHDATQIHRNRDIQKHIHSIKNGVQHDGTRLLLLIIPSRPLEHRRDLVSILFAQPRQHNLQQALARVA